MIFICLPDNGNITDIRTERVRSETIRFVILLCNIINGKRIDVGYDDVIEIGQNLLRISICYTNINFLI